MKKKLLIAVGVLAIAGYAGYRYIYHGARDIAAEDAAFTVKVADLQKEFSANAEAATKKYAAEGGKTIEVAGKVTSMDAAAHSLILDEKVSARLKDSTLVVPVGQQITVKGRFVGYDDLLEEFQLDQTSVVK